MHDVGGRADQGPKRRRRLPRQTAAANQKDCPRVPSRLANCRRFPPNLGVVKRIALQRQRRRRTYDSAGAMSFVIIRSSHNRRFVLLKSRLIRALRISGAAHRLAAA